MNGRLAPNGTLMTLPACSSLFQSGPVQATADGQVFQSAVFNAVAGTATVDLNGHSGIGLKNCVVYHNGGQGLKALVAGNGCWLDTVSFINLAAPAAGGSGGPYNSADVACRNIDLAGQTNFVVKDVYCQDGSRGIALANCTATMITRFHAQNMRGVNPAASSVLAGQAISVAACVDFMLDDFYIYNDPANSFPEDNINLWEVLQAMLAGGLIDGNNSIDGAGIEVDLDFRQLLDFGYRRLEHEQPGLWQLDDRRLQSDVHPLPRRQYDGELVARCGRGPRRLRRPAGRRQRERGLRRLRLL